MPLPKKLLLLPFLAEVCKEEREAHNVSAIRVAAAAGYEAETSISRTFEREPRWPTNADALVAGYAKAINDDDVTVFDLWEKAIERARDAKADLKWMQE